MPPDQETIDRRCAILPMDRHRIKRGRGGIGIGTIGVSYGVGQIVLWGRQS